MVEPTTKINGPAVVERQFSSHCGPQTVTIARSGSQAYRGEWDGVERSKEGGVRSGKVEGGREETGADISWE